MRKLQKSNLTDILSIIFVTIVSLIHTGWKGVIGADVANHLPPVLKTLNLANLNNDWYSITTSETHVHYFYAQLFRMVSWNPTFGTSMFFALFISALVLRVVVIHSIIKSFGGESWWLLVVLAVGILPKPNLYGFILSIDPGLTPRTLSWTLALIAFRYLIKRKFGRFGFFIGLGCIFQPSDGLLNALLLTMVLLGTYYSELNLKKIIQLLLIELFSGVWFSLYVSWLILKSENQVVEPNYLAWSYIYFRAPYLVISNYLLFVVILISLLAMIFAIKFRLEKILLSTILSSSVLICLFAFGVKTLNLRLIELYGVRALGFFFLSSTLLVCYWISSCINHLNLDRYLKSLNNISMFGLAAASLFLLLRIHPIDSIIAGTKAINIQEASMSALKYPCNLPNTQCKTGIPNKSEARDMIEFVFPNNFVSFKQVGVGPANLAEWVSRIDRLTNSELRKEYLAQKKRGKFEPYSLL
jgi:hypothetical protein